MRRLRGRLGLNGFEGVDSNGLSSGITLFWHESLMVHVLDKDDRFIDATVRVHADAEQ